MHETRENCPLIQDAKNVLEKKRNQIWHTDTNWDKTDKMSRGQALILTEMPDCFQMIACGNF